MTAATTLDIVIGLGVLITAVVALFAPERMTSVSVFLGLGVMLTVLWTRLGAPDIALAEAALASGVTGALLMAAITDSRRDTAPRRSIMLTAAEVVVGLAVAAAVAAAFVSASRIGADNDPVGATLPMDEAVVSHPITAVLLQFRSYDTFLEVVVLLAAVVAALSLHPRGLLDAVPSAIDGETVFERRPVFDVFVRLIVPVVVLVAAWLLFAGSSQTGGAFQAGALVAGALLLLQLSGISSTVLQGRWLTPSLVLGVAAFVVVAAFTAALGAGVLELVAPWGKWVVLGLEGALTVSIGVSLSALFLAGRRSTTEAVR